MFVKSKVKMSVLLVFIILLTGTACAQITNESVKILTYTPGSKHVNTSVMLSGEPGTQVQRNEYAIALNYIDPRGFPNATLVMITTPLNFSGNAQLVTLFRPTDNFEGRYTIISIGLLCRTAVNGIWGWVGGDWILNQTVRMNLNSSNTIIRGFGKNPDFLLPIK